MTRHLGCPTKLLSLAFFFAMAFTPRAAAQTVAEPELAYVYPPGGAAGATIEVILGGYEWTPDMQFFTQGERVEIEALGPPGPLLLPEPPARVGSKAYNPLPLPREVRVRLRLPSGLPLGPVWLWAANANGATSPAAFIVGRGRETLEAPAREGPQELHALPADVSGRLARNEEIDSYRFRALRTGPVACELFAARLGSPLQGILEARDASGRRIASAAGSEGRDAALVFSAQAGAEYTLALHDLDFRGGRQFIYRLSIAAGPRVAAALPAAGRRGETREVELLLETGGGRMERLRRPVAFPADPAAASFEVELETPRGASLPFTLLLSDADERVEATREGSSPLPFAAPGAVTGALELPDEADRYILEARKGEAWDLSLEARRLGSPLDVSLEVRGPNGKEVARSDDLPGTTDAGLRFTAPADGRYELIVSDLAGRAGSPAPVYRLAAAAAGSRTALEAPARTNVPLGGKAELLVRLARGAPALAPIAVELEGLPQGVTAAAAELAAGAAEVKIVLHCAADAPAAAALARVRARAGAPPVETIAGATLVAVTLKPVAKIWPLESDERTVNQGATHLSETGIERLDGFRGDLIVEMRSRQPAKFRQGFLGPAVRVPPGVDRLRYPCFLPEGLETVDAYRMSLVALARVSDPRGAERWLASTFPGDISIGITIEGALLKVSAEPAEIDARPGERFGVKVKVLRSPRLPGYVELELRAPPELEGRLETAPARLAPEDTEVVLYATVLPGAHAAARAELTVRATAAASAEGMPEVLAAPPRGALDARFLEHLRAGRLPVVAEAPVRVCLEAGRARRF